MNNVIKAFAVSALLSAGLANSCLANETGGTTNDTQLVTVSGTVQTIRDNDGMIMAVGIRKADGTLIKVFPDAKGKQLGENHGKKAEVQGTFATRASMKVLIVSEFKVK